MLTASRLTSHSHGPGSVSSKSLTSNTSRRSGEANTPKFDRCASPQHCTFSPDRGVGREILRHDHRRPAIERERRHEHPAVADRDQLRDARLGLAFEQLHRIDAVGRRAQRRRGASAAPPPAPPCRGRPLGHRQMRHRHGAPILRCPCPGPRGPGCGRSHQLSNLWCGAFVRARLRGASGGACRGSVGGCDQRPDDPRIGKKNPIQNSQ